MFRISLFDTLRASGRFPGVPISLRDVGSAVLIGCGFSFTVGWLWYPGVQSLIPSLMKDLLPPAGEWSRFFLCVLAALFPLTSLIFGGTGRRLRLFNPHLLHGAALPFMLLLTSDVPITAINMFGYTILCGVATVSTGLFWLSLLCAQRCLAAAISIAVASVVAGLVTLLGPYVAHDKVLGIIPGLFLMSWLLASVGSFSRQRLFTHTTQPMQDWPANSLWYLMPAIVVIAFMEKVVLSTGETTYLALMSFSSASGAFLALTITAFMPKLMGWRIACIGLLLPVLGLLLGQAVTFAQITTGMLSALTAIEISIYLDRRSHNKIVATGMLAGAVALLFFMGHSVGEAVVLGFENLPLIAAIVSILAAGVVVLLGGVEGLAGSAPTSWAQVGATGSVSGRQLKPADPPLTGAALNQPGPLDKLTKAEKRVAELLAAGNSNTAISETLGIALTTTRVHLRNIYRKTGAESRRDLVAMVRAATPREPTEP